jgi:RHS repeat-associated protein
MLQYSCLNWGTSRNFGSSLYDLCPVLNNTNDNGTLQGVSYSNGGPGYSSYLSFAQSFTYDKVNRLASASDTGGWSRTFSYDSYGNMWVSGSSGVPLAGNTPTSNVYSTANRISGSSYDASGNQLAVNGDTATYDAENRLSTVTEPPSMGGGTETLVYDGSGRRVQKILPSGTTNYVYDAFGRLAAEYSTNPSQSPCTTCYLSYDHLGSVRMVTDASAHVIARHDFLPFGEELASSGAGRNGQWGAGNDNVAQKFTGQIRDEETDLDYFNARYFGAALGRFTSPDPVSAGANLANPQSWNKYAYVTGNPLAKVDPSGMSSVTSPPITFQATGICGIACFNIGFDGLYGGGGGGPLNPSRLKLQGNDPGSGYPGSRIYHPATGGTPTAPATPPAAPQPPPPPASGPAPAMPSAPAIPPPSEGNTPTTGSTKSDTASNIQQILNAIFNRPWALSWIIPVVGAPVVAGIGPAGDLEWDPNSHTACAGIGIGASAGHNAAVGPLTNGRTLNGQTYPEGADGILSGWSLSVGGNTAALIGGQAMINGSGWAGGPSVGVPGFSIASTYSACVTF